MKIITLALAAVSVIGSTAAAAATVDVKPATKAAQVSTCYHTGTYYAPDATYYFFDCYDNGDGSY